MKKKEMKKTSASGFFGEVWEEYRLFLIPSRRKPASITHYAILIIALVLAYNPIKAVLFIELGILLLLLFWEGLNAWFTPDD